ncbi:hypothetical protein EV361DRAFT_155773 [Lentinula raphanica]|nr:hypothetical protein EV361DRAFT_155773 [Lentinula raphanica]
MSRLFLLCPLPLLPIPSPFHIPFRPLRSSKLGSSQAIWEACRCEYMRVHAMNGEEREGLEGRHGPVHCVEFSPNGATYASGSEDDTICFGLWQGQNGVGFRHRRLRVVANASPSSNSTSSIFQRSSRR